MWPASKNLDGLVPWAFEHPEFQLQDNGVELAQPGRPAASQYVGKSWQLVNQDSLKFWSAIHFACVLFLTILLFYNVQQIPMST